MRRTKLTATIMLIVASILSSMVPTWAKTIDSINLIDFDFEVTPTSGDEYLPEIYGTNYTTSDFGVGNLSTKKYGRQRIDNVWKGFTTLNFDNIAQGSDFAAYAMVYRDDAVENLSSAEDSVVLAFNIDAQATVSTENLYYAIVTRGDDGMNFAGVPVGSISETQGIALSEFTKPESFLCSTGTGNAIDLAKFCGMGFVRMNVTGDETAPASSGRIFTSELAVLKLDAIDDLEVSAVKGKAVLSFTAPLVEGFEYVVKALGSDGSEREITLSASDFAKDGDKFVWTDAQTQQETTYTYTITLNELTYGLSSVSNSAAVTIPEDIGGDEIPSEGDSSAIVDVDSEDYHWISSSAWGNQAFGGFGEGNIFSMVTSSPFGSGRIMATDFGYDKCFKNAAEAAEKMAHVVDYYTTGYLALEISGGPGNAYKECVNASKAEGGYAVYSLYIDETVDLTNAYFSIGQRWYGNKDVQVFAGVPMANYVTQADKGKKIKVAVPLDDFKMSNPEAFCRIWKFNWEPEPVQERVDVDLQYLCFIGLLRNCEEGIEKPATSGYVYIEDLKVCKVNPVKELEIRDSTPSKIVLGWEHTDTAVEKYNIYREVNGEKEKIGTSTINRFADIPAEGFQVNETYTYYVEAEDELGIVSASETVSAKIEAIGKPRTFKAQNYYSDTDTLAIDISWQAPAYGDVEKYVLYRNGTVYQEIGADATSYRDYGASYGVDYTYYMYAVDTNGNKSINTEEFTLTSACVPEVKNVSYSVSGRNITYSWEENPYATEYAVKVNDDIYYTQDTTYTVEGFPYYTEVNTSIWAINASGAKSVVSTIRKFAIEKPGDVVSQTIFTDATASGFKATTLGYAETKAVTDKYVIGSKSLLCDFSERSTEDQAVILQKSAWDVTEHRKNNARLSFWIYADDEVDYNKVKVGLQGSTTMNWTNAYPIYSNVNLGDYASEKGKWVYVEIPFGDFDQIGEAKYQGQFYYKELDFEKLTGIAFAYDNLSTTNGGKFYLDNIRVVKGSGWQISSACDENGTAITSAISANAKEIRLSFTEAVDSSSFTSKNVWLEDENGGVVNTFITFENGVCKIKLLEALAQNTGYSLKLDSVKSAQGASESLSLAFTSNADAQDGIEATLSDIVPNITNTASGSTVTLDLSLPQGAVYNVADYTVTVAYDRTVLNTNGANTVSLSGLAGASVAFGDGVITISGNAGKAEISGSLATVKFSVVNTTTTTAVVGGSFDIANVKADKTKKAMINATKSFAVTRGGSAVGGGGGGGGGGGTASRDDATIKGDSKIEPTEGEGSLEDISTPVFTDINNVAWAKDAILALVKEGVMSGYPDNTVKPENTITREEFTSLLMRAFSFKTEITESPFADVANDAWYANAVIAAKEKGIVSGVDSENFGIGSTITREDMCTMIYRAIQVTRMVVEDKFDAYRFADEDAVSEYAVEAVNSLYRYGVISGVSETEFSPKAYVNRAMAARVLYGVINLM